MGSPFLFLIWYEKQKDKMKKQQKCGQKNKNPTEKSDFC